MTIKLSVTYKDTEKFVWIKFESSLDDETIEIYEPEKQEQVYDESKYWTTIAANISDEAEEEFNIDEYMEQLKNELIESGDISEENNYIDDQKRIERNLREGITSFVEDKGAEDIKEKKEKTSAEIASQYRGPTRIYYDLENRFHRKLPLPIYLCEGDGKVVVDIAVNRKGSVLKSSINNNETAIVNECLYKAAIKAASQSRFNISYSAPEIQKGRITYHFKAQ